MELPGVRRRPDIVLKPIEQQALEALWQKLEQGEYGLEETDCVCGERDDRVVGTHDRYGLPLPLALCRRCGVMRANPRLDDASLKSFYDQDYRELYLGSCKADDFFFSEQVEQGARIRRFVSRGAPGHELRRVFDVGCGAGGALVPFVAAGAEVFGCDLGSGYLEYGRRIGLRLEHGEAGSLSKFGRADMVILSHVLEHLPAPVTVLRGIRDQLVDGGLLYVELPGALNIHGFYGSLRRSMHIAHLFQFSLGSLTGVLARAGFRLLCGDESVRALFVRAEQPVEIETQGEAERIATYLRWVRPRAILRRALVLAGLQSEVEDDDRGP